LRYIGSREPLLRIVELDAGAIKIDGVNIKDVGLKKLRSGIAVGAASLNWPKYFLPQNPMKIGDPMRIGFIKMTLKFEVKKLTKSSPFCGKMSEKVVFTSEMQSCL
jgi:hypothetical protein